MTRKIQYESREQIALIRWAKMQHPDTLGNHLFAIPNGGTLKGGPREGARRKAEGVGAGVSDLFLPIPRNGFHGLWLELKATHPNNAAVSKVQLEWGELMTTQGYFFVVCLGWISAKDQLEAYLNS